MNKKTKRSIFIAFLLIVFNGTLYLALADDHKGKKWYEKILNHDDHDDHSGKHGKKKRERHKDDDHNERYLKQVNDPIYKNVCGGCHFVYQPELLPSASWMEILANLDDHFGESVELDTDSSKTISGYLKSHSAENSSAKRAAKIMRSLGGRVPLRITDIPYIREKHHELSSNVLKRESIGSLSNCSACHTTAEKGIYEDDNVKIPR
ncbi:MAG: diheme cytochrome c [Desulfobacterium sp.]|nr:diheme cytochrome c [Desulfobacterium sp.]